MRKVLVALFCIGLLPCTAWAQERSKTKGFNLRVQLNGSAIKVEDADETESGGGLGFAVGYGFSPRLMVYLGGEAAQVSAEDGPDYWLGHGDLGVRYTFANPSKAFIPFLQGAFNVRIVTYEDFENGEDLEYSGTGATMGGGAGYFVSRKLAIEAALNFSFGKFTEVKLGDESGDLADDFSASSTRLNVGLSWYPGR